MVNLLLCVIITIIINSEERPEKKGMLAALTTALKHAPSAVTDLFE
jgi:hypothetical protein